MADSTLKAALFSQDLALVKDLATRTEPTDQDITTAGRLFIRYNGLPGNDDLKQTLSAAVASWGLTKADINARCFKLWNSGYRPGEMSDEVTVGSGADND